MCWCWNDRVGEEDSVLILLACPNARIYQFSESGISEIAYTDTEHYQVTRDFLNRHERMIDLLISAEDADLESKRRK
jgi:hypothetical protein